MSVTYQSAFRDKALDTVVNIVAQRISPEKLKRIHDENIPPWTLVEFANVRDALFDDTAARSALYYVLTEDVVPIYAAAAVADKLGSDIYEEDVISTFDMDPRWRDDYTAEAATEWAIKYVVELAADGDVLVADRNV